jgi:formylglycine-generating enzyme required for sulfatase activity
MRAFCSNNKFALRFVSAALLACAAGAVAQHDPGSQATDQAEAVGEEAQAEERRVRRLGDVAGDEFELDLSIPEAPPAGALPASEYDLPDPDQNARLQRILSSLATRPGNVGLLAQLDELLSDVLAEAHALADAGRLEEAAHRLRVVRNVNPQKEGLEAAYQRLERLRNVDHWLASAEAALNGGQLIRPDEANALRYYQLVLEADPGNEPAAQGLLTVQQGLVERALDAARDFDFELADEWLSEAASVLDDQALVDETRAEITTYRAAQADRIEGEVLDAIAGRDFDYAEFILIDLIALGGYEERVAELRARLQEARTYGQFAPGDVIHDFFPDSDVAAPPVVVIATGSFLMGSLPEEEDRSDSEGPKHRVTISRGFALGVTEVTVGEFRLFVESSGYKTRAELEESSWVYDEGTGRITRRERVNWRHGYEGRRARDSLPVLHVDWNDARAYTQWLSRRTGQSYRLPSEAEWEYAVRAGSVTPYWWGDGRPTEPVENLTGDGDVSSTGRNWGVAIEQYDDGYWGPAPTGSLEANAFGLHDMGGNVSEWTEDCWHDTYVRAPADGSAWVNPGCAQRVVRGGYWAGRPSHARSAARYSADPDLRGPRVGFRVARDL